MTTEERTAKAAERISQALELNGLLPSGLTESGNVADGFNLVVEIDGHDYDVEIIAAQFDEVGEYVPGPRKKASAEELDVPESDFDGMV